MKANSTVIVIVVLLALGMIAPNAASVESSPAATAEHLQPAVETPVPLRTLNSINSTPSGSECLAELDLAKAILLSDPLTDCEQQCFRNEGRCLVLCYNGCGDSSCYAACDQNCTETRNACMCACGSDLCNPDWP